MRLAEVQRRVREAWGMHVQTLDNLLMHRSVLHGLYRDTLRTLLDHEISDDARALIEAALEAER